MSPLDAIARLEGLERDATPGRWDPALAVGPGYRLWALRGPPDPDVANDCRLLADLFGQRQESNAKFIALARNALPALLAVARAAQQVACVDSLPEHGGLGGELQWIAPRGLGGMEEADATAEAARRRDALDSALAALAKTVEGVT